MQLNTSDENGVKPFLKSITFPKKVSHKGQNGKLLIIGGSSLFHAASLWSASIASKIVDMVHYMSTVENEKIFVNLKSKFVDGIVINRKHLLDYVEEDDCILIGPGMLRGQIPQKNHDLSFEEILEITNESDFTHYLVRYLMQNFPHKKYVLDAGALQMLDKSLLSTLKKPAIITPHAKEFEKLFSKSVFNKNVEEIEKIVASCAQVNNCTIHLKSINDYISDGKKTITVCGGNAGLTKGGTGDVLAGLVAALNTTNPQFLSCVVSSYLLKKSAEIVFESDHYWFNTSRIIDQIPKTLKHLLPSD